MMHSILRYLAATLVALCLSLPQLALPAEVPLAAEVPWQAADVMRMQGAQLQRLLFRPADPVRLDHAIRQAAEIQHAWRAGLRDAYLATDPAAAEGVDRIVEDLAEAVADWDAVSLARSRARLWTVLTGGAMRGVLKSLEKGAVDRAAAWHNIRDYSRSSRETAAAIALRELQAGRFDSVQARRVIEAELLGVEAGELRRALSEARGHIADKHPVQLAGTVARADSLYWLLQDNIAARLGPEVNADLRGIFQAVSLTPDTVTEDLDRLLAMAEERLATYSPVSLEPQELARRAQVLIRFLGLVPVEYEKGVHDGVVTIPFEYFEANLFRDRAEMLLGDLGADLSAREPETFERLTLLLARLRQRIDAIGDEREVRQLTHEARDLVLSAYSSLEMSSGPTASLLMLPDLLDELLIVATAGDWADAEMKRLEAYALFDPDVEQHLMPRDPALAMQMESAFWEGSTAIPGLGRAIAEKVPENTLRQSIQALKSDIALAGSILATRPTALSAFLQSLAILVREGLEAVLVLACMVGVLKAGDAAVAATGVQARTWRMPVIVGVLSALVASFALWFAVGRLFAMSTLERELLEGLCALTAAAVLLYVTHWVFRKAYVTDWIAEIRRKTTTAFMAGSAGEQRPAFVTLFLLAFFVVFREGFETVLFYEALLIDAPGLPVLAGLVSGTLIAVLVGYLILRLERRLPVALFFRLTGILLALLCLMLVGSGVRGLQTAALLPATPVGWFPSAPWLQIYLGLYPVAEALAAQALTGLLLASSLLLLLRQRTRERAQG